MFKRNGVILGKKFVEYLIPTILSNMAVLLASFIDGIIVSAINGSDAFSAVNLAEPVVLYMQAVFFLFGIGGAVSISVAKGQRDNKKANKLFSLSLCLGLIVSVLSVIIGAAFIDAIVAAICNEANLVPQVKDYALVTIYGAPLMVLVPQMSFLVRADGMPKLSANILLVSNIVNLIMDFVYIGGFNMGTGGAALATVTGYFVGLLLVIFGFFMNKKRTLHFIVPKPDTAALAWLICGGGIASTINTVLLFAKAILLNRIVLDAGGANAMAVFSVCNFTLSFISMFISGGADTMTPIIGILFGEKDYKGMDFIFKKTMRFVTICCGVTIAFMLAFPNLILMMFSVNSAGQLEIGVTAVRIFAVSLAGMGVSYVLMNYYQTIYQKGISIMITLLRGIAFTVPCAFVMSKLFGLSGIWWAFVVSEGATVLITLIVCKIKVFASKGRFTGILLHEKLGEGEKLYTATVIPDTESSTGLSKELMNFCKENGEDSRNANFIGVLAEEIIENIKEFNHGGKNLLVDFICRISSDSILISVRDNGKTLKSVEPDGEKGKYGNLYMINKIADEIDYTRSLGLNNTVIVLRRKKC